MDILDNYIRHHIEKHSHLFSINYKIETFFAKCYDISAEPYLINLESILYNKRIDNLYIGSYRKDDHYYKLFTFIEKTELCSVSKESFNLLGEKLALFHNSFREDNENYSKQVVVYDYEYFSEITLMLNKIRQQNNQVITLCMRNYIYFTL